MYAEKWNNRSGPLRGCDTMVKRNCLQTLLKNFHEILTSWCAFWPMKTRSLMQMTSQFLSFPSTQPLKYLVFTMSATTRSYEKSQWTRVRFPTRRDVFVNSFVVHVQKLCDLTLTSLTDGRSARDLPKQHRTKKNSMRFNLVFGRRHLVHGCGASMFQDVWTIEQASTLRSRGDANHGLNPSRDALPMATFSGFSDILLRRLPFLRAPCCKRDHTRCPVRTLNSY